MTAPRKKHAGMPPADDTLKHAEGTGEPMVGIDVPLGEVGVLDAPVIHVLIEGDPPDEETEP